jgi:hypothetical protein
LQERRVEAGDKKWELWDRNYEAIHAFATKHGHLKLPSYNPETRRLATWLRLQARRAQLLDYQKEKLDVLLSTYRPNRKPREEREQEAWDQMYKNLLTLYGQNGDFVVSMEDDKPLHKWIIRQRSTARQGKLLDERREKLEATDFEFQCNVKYTKTSFTAQQVKQWEKMQGQLAEFRTARGHCMVPYNYEANPTLGRWVSKQRTDFRQDAMDPERRDRLDELRFTWTMQGLPRR